MSSTTHYGTDTSESCYLTADAENITSESDSSSGEITSEIAVSATENSHSWITPAGTPGFPTWPTSNGSNYQASINVTTMGSDLSLNAAQFYRVNAAASSLIDSETPTWSSTTGTGVKTASVANSADLNGGSTSYTDRLQLTVNVTWA